MLLRILGSLLRHTSAELWLDAYFKKEAKRAILVAPGYNAKKTRRLLQILSASYPRPQYRVSHNNGVILKTDVSDTLGATLFYGFPTADAFELEIVSKLVAPRDVCIDIGANIGLYTLTMAQAMGTEGRIYSFEPSPQTFTLLKENIALNSLSNITLEQAAVSERSGKAALTVTSESGLASLGNTGRGTITGSVRVPTVSLDEYTARYNIRPDFIKIDVEGFEGHVIRGARRTLQEGDAALLIELDKKNFDALGISKEKILKDLRALRFVGWSIDRTHKKLVPAEVEKGVNYLFVKEGGVREKRAKEMLAAFLQ